MMSYSDFRMSIRIHSAIVGLHSTGNGSHPLLLLDVEEDNLVEKDPDCMRVVCNYVPPQHKALVTWPANPDKNRPSQLAAQIEGKKIGNVPANLCGFFRQCREIEHITASSKTNRPVGVAGPRRLFQKMPENQQDRSGKGVELPCKYDIYVQPQHRSHVERQVQQFLETYDGNAWMETLQTRIRDYLIARGGVSYYSDEDEE